MGLAISRILIAMENQPLVSPPPPRPEEDEEPPVFHKSKLLRIILAIGLIAQVCIGVLCIMVSIFDGYGYSRGSEFSLEILRILGFLYTLLILWVSTTWFMCIYYNKTLPRDRVFIILELLRSVPWLLVAIVFVIFWIPEIIYFFVSEMNGGYYRGGWSWFLGRCLAFVFVFVPAMWSLFWMFFYFIRERKEEIVKILKIGRKKEDETALVDIEAARPGDGEADEGEEGSTEAERREEREETPLLIDHDQIV
ncbi:hypothetical protein TWF481_000095 [Arthrobotrys musiformis]|uniref:Transmembrane protein n=1 Tax=Arthrobotrys musiformis TaxID=47236 RepID=A0AAV9WLL5_9PEZI